MLVKFCFDFDCFSADSLRSEFDTNAHTLIKDYWALYGILILPKDFDTLHFLKTIDAKYKNRWVEIFSKKIFRTHIEENQWETLEVLSQKTPKYSGIKEFQNYFNVIIMDETNYQSLTEDPIYEIIKKELECLPPGKIADSSYFNSTNTRLKKLIAKNETLENIWTSKFSDICKFSKNITIIDRYFYKSLAEDYLNGRETSIDFLLKKIADFDEKYTRPLAKIIF